MNLNPPPTKILVFRFGQIGDTVAALPCLWVLRQRYPEAKIVMLNEISIKQTHMPPDSVLPPYGLVDGFEQYPAGATLSNVITAWRLLSRLRKDGFGTLIYLVPSARTKRARFRDRIFFRLIGIRSIIAVHGFPEVSLPRKSDGTLAPLPKEADALLERLRIDGLPVPARGKGSMDLCITDRERARVEEWWRQKGGTAHLQNGWIAICVGGKTSAQLWPLDRYGRVVQMLIGRLGLFPVVVGGKEDIRDAKMLLAQWGLGLCAAGDLTVRESAALMAGARFYLGNDTGVMHLAAAMGIPCVAIFSARNQPGIWEPYGERHTVLRHDVSCAGCGLAVCNHNQECLTGINVEQVYEACVKTLDLQTSNASTEA